MFRHLICTAALICAAGAAAPALAGPDTVRVSETVYIGDLDQNTPKGVKSVERRVAYAAQKICDHPRSPLLRGGLRMRRCKDDAVASAMSEFHALQASLGAGRQVAAISATRP
jgi:UrcA family protein